MYGVVISRLAYRYFVLFIDDCTRYAWVYFMRHKSEGSPISKPDLTMCRTQFDVNEYNKGV